MQTLLCFSRAAQWLHAAWFLLLSDPGIDAVANDLEHRTAISCLTFRRVEMGGTWNLDPLNVSTRCPKLSLNLWYESADVVEITFPRDHQERW